MACGGDEVVGQVQIYENEGERELFGALWVWAWTEHISTKRAGAVAALVAAGLRQLGEVGCDPAALGFGSENPIVRPRCMTRSATRSSRETPCPIRSSDGGCVLGDR